MKHLLYLNSILLLVSSCSSCDPLGLDDTCKQNYLFDIPIRVTPVQDTFQVGDTLHISIEFPTQMENQLTGDTIDMSAFPFNTVISFAKIDVNPQQDADHLVQYIVKQGDLEFVQLIGAIRTYINFNKQNNTYFFECEVVLEHKGLFGMSFKDSYLMNFDGQLEEHCVTDTIDMNFSLYQDSSGIDYNFHLLEFSTDANIQRITTSKFDKYGAFAFWVVEN